MKKMYTLAFIGKITLALLFGFALMQPVAAQTVVISTGTPGTPQYNAGPIYRSAATSAYDASRYAYLYTADELNAVGITPGAIINILGWAKANNAVTNGGAIFRIYLKNSSATTYGLASETWANLSNGATMVYENLSQQIPATMSPDYITFPLTVPFTYTGGSLEVMTEWDINQVAGTATSGTFQWLWSTVPNRIYGTGQTSLANSGTLSSTTNSISTIDDRRPFLQITYTPGGPCTDPPTLGTVTPSAVNVCMGMPFSLTYLGGSNGIGQTMQWQVSTDGGATWNDIAGETGPVLNTTQAVSSDYRLQVTCGTSVVTPSVTINSPAGVLGNFTINQLAPPSATNFQSFNAAYDFIRCGIIGNVVFDVLNGPYTEQLIMDEVPGAGPGATITFNGNNQVIQFTSTNTNERAVIKLNGTDYITFNNLQVNPTGTTTSEYGFGFHLLNDPNTVTINGCTINLNNTSTSANYGGIIVSASNTSATGTGTVLADDLFFINNTINGGNYGITLVGSSTEANRNCVIVGNTINDFNGYGIYVMGSFNVLVEGNNIQRPFRQTTTTSYGIYFTGLSVSAQVLKNRISNPHGIDNNSTGIFYGIYFNGVDAFAGLENRLINNVIYNFTGSGNVVGIYNAGSDNLMIYHNTISMDGDAPNATASHYTRAFYQTTEAGGVDFRNNLISITRGGPSEKHGYYFNTATSLIQTDHNNIFIAPGVANAFTGRWQATDHVGLAAWQAATLQDASSITTDPIFAGAPGGNFLPTNASMNDLGTALGVTTDINNVTRHATTPDMGAYEFTPLPCVAPPTAGTAIVVPNVVCENMQVSLAGLGNSTGLSQTYQWESSPTNAAPWTAVSGVLTNPTFSITASTSLYYRLAVTCNGNTQYTPGTLLTVNPALPGPTYTINGLQPTGGLNYNSFNDAYLALSCGISGPITFEVNPAGGPYIEQLIMEPIFGSSATNTITFNGNGATIRFEPTVTGERAVIKLRGADHIIFDSLIVDASGPGATYGFGFHLTQDADSNVIRNCDIRSNLTSTLTNYAGIVISNTETSATSTGATMCDGNIVDNNTITGGYYGITLTGSTADRVMNNRITNNTIRDFHTYGIYLAIVGETLVEKNDISRPSRSVTNTHYGVYGSGSSQGVQISKNTIHNPFGGTPGTTSDFYGIYLTGFDGGTGAGFENVISNNLIHSVNGEGDYTGLYNTSSDNALYYHNTVVLENPSSSSNLTTRGFYQTTTATGIQLRNNIFYIDRGGTGNQHVVYFNTAASQIDADRNVYFITPGNSRFIGRINATDHSTIQAWQAASSRDANSQAINPEFAALVLDDYTPTLGAVDNMGTPVGITTDIFDAARSATTPDAGAIEFAVPPCIVPPTPGNTEVTPNTGICIGTTVLLNLNGNSAGGGQTYQWQASTSATGPWNDISPVLNSPAFLTEITSAAFFRAVITCSGNSVTSPVEGVTLNSYLPEGYYTIDPSGPATLPNFQSFSAAVAAIQCGIGGEVKFFVVPGTYNEQIRIGRVGGTGPGSRVIFESQSGVPSSVTLTTDASASPNGPYTVKLDSAEYITFKNMTIAGTGSVARAVEFAGSVRVDSIYNCIINVPVVTSTSTTTAGIWGTDLIGADSISILNNTVAGGYAGIALDGVSTAILANRLVIDSNRVGGFYQYGIYTGFNKRLQAIGNTIEMAAPLNATAYGMYNTSADTAMNVSYNVVNINNTTTTAYGIYFTGCDASSIEPGRVIGNKVIGLRSNSGSMYGMYHTASVNINRINNILNIATTGSTAYGFYSTGGNGGVVYNNTVRNTSTANSTTNMAAYITQTTSGGNGQIQVRNNIFDHSGGGIAYGVGNVNHVNTDYNFLYTSGNIVVRRGTVNHLTLQAWRNDAFWDMNSIVYQPVYSNTTDLEPDVTSPNVWAMHGRGTQIEDNNVDYHGNPRPTTLTTGVPDMGAYEFLPTSLPTVLTAVPANPAPGITQTFFYGTDTVTKITYAAGSTVPDNVELRRYSGIIPPGLATGQPSTYFYTEADITGAQPSDIKVEQHYIDPWQGFIPDQVFIKLGRTDAANAWQVNAASTVDEVMNVFTDEGLNFMDKFTGLMDGSMPPNPPTILPPADSSNRGTHFWVGYGHHQGFEGANGQDMILYFSAEQPANVVVRINGTSYAREYQVPANSVITSQLIPKTGVFDARLLIDGKSTKGISITSDVPIVAYAHIYASTTSEASLLLPVGTYGYEYTALTTVQNYATNTYSWAYVVAAFDSTRVEITPSNPTLNGRPAGVPFVVNLNKGEVYQVLGALLAPSSSDGYDMTGTFFRSIPNDNDRCLPIAVFSGSSRTNIGCGTSTPTASGDNILEQNFPYSAWGKKYLVAPTSNSSSASSFHTNIYRVAVRDPATNVWVTDASGTNLLTGLRNNFYYQFESNTPDVITADQPIIVAQIMSSSGACPNTGGSGDPGMIYVSPVEQGIKNIGLYRNTQSAITSQYLTMVVPTNGLPSLLIDNQNTWDHSYLHSEPCYTVVVKRWSPAANAQVLVSCDSAFTAITYGLGSVESYGYNAGTLVRNLNSRPSITNVLGDGSISPYTCVDAPFTIGTLISVKPTTIQWTLSNVPGLSPNADVFENNPTPVDSTVINGDWFYQFNLPGTFTVSQVGQFVVPIYITHPDIEGCNNRLEISLELNVRPSPEAEFSVDFTGCLGDVTSFTGITTSNGVPIIDWHWNFGNGDTAITSSHSLTYTAAGIYDVNFSIITADGCIGDSTMPVEVRDRPTLEVVDDTLGVCGGSTAAFMIANPDPALTYSWYDAPTGGTLLGTGTTFNTTAATTTSYWVEAAFGDCISDVRVEVVLEVGTTLSVALVQPEFILCNAGDVTFEVLNPVAGATYTWYDAPTGGNAVHTGTTFPITNANASIVYYVEGQTGTCTPDGRTPATITVVPLDAVVLVEDTLAVCGIGDVTFEISNPDGNVTYNWYDTPTGGTPVHTGTTFTVTGITGNMEFWVEAAAGTCVSIPRTHAVVLFAVSLAAPVVTVAEEGQDYVTFSWNAVPLAASYSVSLDNGATWEVPSSGASGLTHTVSGLTPDQSVTIIVRAELGTACASENSAAVTGTARSSEVFIPNSFTPNGDGLNDILQVYGNSVETLRFMVFNQWGEKLTESTNPANAWDGRHRGKLQPSGVYMYVAQITLRDGTVLNRKGSINLIR